jgi:saccharopine dehydrogenase-like NADP-dependent oxidoreductase
LPHQKENLKQTRKIKMKNSIVVYGAYGHTGKFIVSQLLQQGFTPTLSGRDKEKLLSYSQQHPNLETKVADIIQPDSLDNAFSGSNIIVNCAGPYLDTAEPIIQSALRLGKHYIDLSAEQKSVLDIFEQYSGQAKQAEIIIIPAAAFYGGLGDLLSSALTQNWNTIDEIGIYIGLDSWHPTKGTRLTGERNHYQRLVFTDGKLQPLQAGTPITWGFPKPIETKEMIKMPLSEIITISRHLNVRNINTFISLNSIEDIRKAETPEPKPTDEKNRSSQHFCMEVVALRGNKKRKISAQGRDIYAVTAPLVVEAIKRIITGNNDG